MADHDTVCTRADGVIALAFLGATVVAGVAVWHADTDCGPAEDVELIWIAAQPDLARHFDRFPAAARQRVHDDLDAYVRRWSAAWDDACASDSKPRVACLEPARGVLASIAEALRSYDVALAERMPAVVRSLPSLDECEQAGDLVEEVRLRRQHARVDLLLALERNHEADGAVTGLAEAARAAGLPGLQADAQLQVATLAMRRGDREVAQWAAADAYALADEIDDAKRATRAALLLTRIDRKDARRWVDAAELGHGLDGELHRAAAAIAAEESDDRALRHHVDLAIGLSEPELAVWEFGELLGELAMIELERGHSTRARALAERGAKLVEESLGASHPRAGMLRVKLARIAAHREEIATAYEHMLVAESALGGSHRIDLAEVAAMYREVGLLEAYAGDWGPAREHLTRAVDATKEVDLEVLYQLGIAELELGVFDSARERFERLAMEGTGFDGYYSDALVHLGLVAMSEGKLDQAKRHFESALEQDEAVATLSTFAPPITQRTLTRQALAIAGLAVITLEPPDEATRKDLVSRHESLERPPPRLDRLLQTLGIRPSIDVAF